ncbi:MAG: CopG family transcriptional regulator [Lachnospiraceae bacterium]|nr:CopG family transcriptional regulator [Lachnospiraceae bacterium]
MRTGRPVAEDPRAYKISARLTAKELEEFEAYAKRHDLTNAEVIKRGIKMQLDQEKQKSQ